MSVCPLQRTQSSLTECPRASFKLKGVFEKVIPSPFLFDIVVEALCRMTFVAGEANLITGFKLAVNGPTITHLQFVDDTIIFCDAKEEQIKNVVAILRCFEVVLGLKVIFCF